MGIGDWGLGIGDWGLGRRRQAGRLLELFVPETGGRCPAGIFILIYCINIKIIRNRIITSYAITRSKKNIIVLYQL